MPIHNTDIAEIFDEIADLLEIQGDNPFRVRAYRMASLTLKNLGTEVSTLLEKGEDLTKIRGIGEDLAKKIQEILQTGTAKKLEELRKKVPPSLRELMRIPGLGPKRVKVLYDTLGVDSVEKLKTVLEKGQVKTIRGFGEKLEKEILEGIQKLSTEEKRFLLPEAEEYGNSYLKYLSSQKGIKKVVLAGSFRRRKETVGDLDILATVSSDPSSVAHHFVSYDEVEKVLSEGETRSSVILRSGIQVDLRIVKEEEFGSALHYFTGSKAHNIAIRQLGNERGLKINEYGVFSGEKRVGGKEEEEIFHLVGLPWIPPELREDRGEILSAREGKLPVLVRVEDLRGDLHCHTRYSDGKNTVREMVEEARSLGYEYLAITDHSPRLGIARGVTWDRLRKEWEEIDRLNEEMSGFKVLKGMEVEILEDGSLDIPVEVARELDLVIGAVHSQFHLSLEKQTTRILKAMEFPYFTFLAHPTGRLLKKRSSYEVDIERIIAFARERGCFLEINGQPMRLDLNDIYAKVAKEAGVLLVISSDAHSKGDLSRIRYGVDQGRRGWLTAKDVVNTRPLPELLTLLKKTRLNS